MSQNPIVIIDRLGSDMDRTILEFDAWDVDRTLHYVTDLCSCDSTTSDVLTSLVRQGAFEHAVTRFVLAVGESETLDRLERLEHANVVTCVEQDNFGLTKWCITKTGLSSLVQCQRLS